MNTSFFLPVIEIFKKETKTFFNSYLGWLILFIITVVNGLLSWWAIHQEAESGLTLQLVFYRLSGTTMVAGGLIGMKFFAEEKSLGTLELLFTAPIQESQILLGKFFSGILFLLFIMFASFPIPAWIMIYGDAQIGHVVSGYLGVLFIGMTSIAISTFFSTLTKVQLLAALMALANICIFLLLGFFSPYVDNPMKSVIRELSLYVHYRDFEKGVLVFRHIIFFLSVTIFYLYISVVSLRSRRWQ